MLETGTYGCYVMSTVPGIYWQQLCCHICAIRRARGEVLLYRSYSDFNCCKRNDSWKCPSQLLLRSQANGPRLKQYQPLSQRQTVVNQAFNEHEASGEQQVRTAGTAGNLQRQPAFKVWRVSHDTSHANVACMTGPTKANICHSICFRELHARPCEGLRHASFPSAQGKHQLRRQQHRCAK